MRAITTLDIVRVEGGILRVLYMQCSNGVELCRKRSRGYQLTAAQVDRPAVQYSD